jgi:hypothetical protein
MTQHNHPVRHGTADAGAQLARLGEVLALVEEIAGHAPTPGHDRAFDEAARVSAAYEAALPIVQRRFDMLATETGAWAAAGVETLVVLRERQRPARAAAGRLAQELRQALSRLRGIVSA